MRRTGIQGSFVVMVTVFRTTLLGVLLTTTVAPAAAQQMSLGPFRVSEEPRSYSEHDGTEPIRVPPSGDKGTVYRIGHVPGRQVSTFGFAGALYGLGRLTHRPDLEDTSHQLLDSLVVTNLLVGGLKHAVGRERPDGSDDLSFPSGHAAGMFTIATVLHRRHGLKVGLPAYSLASFVAFSRVHGRVHNPSDVVVGAAIGTAIGLGVTRLHDRGLAVIPYLGSDRKALTVGIQW